MRAYESGRHCGVANKQNRAEGSSPSPNLFVMFFVSSRLCGKPPLGQSRLLDRRQGIRADTLAEDDVAFADFGEDHVAFAVGAHQDLFGQRVFDNALP